MATRRQARRASLSRHSFLAIPRAFDARPCAVEVRPCAAEVH